MENYSVFSYNTCNLGDEIQSWAAIRHIGAPSYFVPRETPWLSAGEPRSRLIANGWYLHNPFAFFLPENVKPFYVSIHIADETQLNERVVAHFKKHQPIGCRDLATLRLLEKHAIEAYFSGCLTTTLKSESTERTDKIILVDVEPELRSLVPEKLAAKAQLVTHETDLGFTIGWTYQRHRNFRERLLQRLSREFFSSNHVRFQAALTAQRMLTTPNAQSITRLRMQLAKERLALYASAKLVITSRLHCALPCLAFGTPVIYLRQNKRDKRLEGFESILSIHNADDRKISWSPDPVDISTFQKKVLSHLAPLAPSPDKKIFEIRRTG